MRSRTFLVAAVAMLIAGAWGPAAQADPRSRMKERRGDMEFEAANMFTLRFYDAVKGTPIQGATIHFVRSSPFSRF